MEQQPTSRIRTPVPDEARLADLIKELRNGVKDADAELRRIFLPGCCFLIQRRLDHGDVQEQARSVLDSAIKKIREDNSIDGGNLPGLVRQLIGQAIPANQIASVARNGASRTAREAAAGVLAALSPVERDALRRCYVLGESPDSFLTSLKLTPDQFHEIRLRARVNFSNKTHQTNVA